MPQVQVFDPAMCCTTGVCGPEVDPSLARFASDLEWLRSNGVEVARFNLSQEPAAFVANAVVAAAMRGRDDALPLLLLDGRIVAQGAYPVREALAGLVGLTAASASATGTAIGGEAAPKACCTPKAPKDAAAPNSCCTPKDETAAGAGKCC